MELALRRNRINYKWFLIPLTLLCLAGLIPSAIVFASALTDPTVGMSGVNNSDLTVGMTGVGNNDLLLDFNPADWHINPSEYPILLSIPLIFFLVAFLFIIKLAFREDLDIKTMVVLAVLIFTALALLIGVNSNTNMLFGG